MPYTPRITFKTSIPTNVQRVHQPTPPRSQNNSSLNRQSVSNFGSIVIMRNKISNLLEIMNQTIDSMERNAIETTVPNQVNISEEIRGSLFFKPLKKASQLRNNVSSYLKQHTAISYFSFDLPEAKDLMIKMLHIIAEIAFSFLEYLKEQVIENLREHRWLTIACFAVGAFISCYHLVNPESLISNVVHELYNTLNFSPILIKGVITIMTGATSAALLPNTLHLISTLIEQLTHYFSNQHLEAPVEYHPNLLRATDNHHEVFDGLIQLLKPHIESTLYNGVESVSYEEDIDDPSFGPSMGLSNNNSENK